ncbi:hypothetical protein Lal_00043023 [Lupinus albus]|nr:hypothetical protein Lal_00043023 [Lupinus albus]
MLVETSSSRLWLEARAVSLCFDICVLRASACGLPIRPVLKHGPRSLTCVRLVPSEVILRIAGARGRVLSVRTPKGNQVKIPNRDVAADGNPDVGSSGWKSTARRVVSGAPPAALENPEDRVPPTPGRKGLALRAGHGGPSPGPVGCRWTARAALTARVGRRVPVGGRIRNGPFGASSPSVEQRTQNWVRFRRGSLRNGYHIQGRQQARKLPNPDTGRRTTTKAFANDVFIYQERKLGARRRSDTVLVSTINDADQGSANVAFRTPLAPYEKSKSSGSRGSMVARLKLKGIDGRAPPGVEPAA